MFWVQYKLKMHYAGYSVTVCKHSIQTRPHLLGGTPSEAQALSPEIMSAAHSAQPTQ